MTIRIHIERLVLEGFPEAPDGSASLQSACESELTRLVVQGGLHPTLASGGAWARLSGDSIRFQNDAKPAALGTQIARAAYFFFFNDTATTEIYTLSLHDALPI